MYTIKLLSVLQLKIFALDQYVFSHVIRDFFILQITLIFSFYSEHIRVNSYHSKRFLTQVSHRFALRYKKQQSGKHPKIFLANIWTIQVEYWFCQFHIHSAGESELNLNEMSEPLDLSIYFLISKSHKKNFYHSSSSRFGKNGSFKYYQMN